MEYNKNEFLPSLHEGKGTQFELLKLWERYNPHVYDEEAPARQPGFTSLSTITILDKCKRNAKFCQVFDSGYEGVFPSHSEADVYLCGVVAFWSDRDPRMIDDIFRMSALMRGKWNRVDYRERTIEKAIGWCKEDRSEYITRKNEERRSMILDYWKHH